MRHACVSQGILEDVVCDDLGIPHETNLLGYNIHSNDYSESSVANPMAYKL